MIIMENQLEKKITEALENVEPWQRVPTTLEGAFLVKTPEKGNNKTIMVEINPLNEHGTPMKRRGIFLRHVIELERFMEVMQNDNLSELMKALDRMSGGNGVKKSEGIKTLEI